MHGIQTAEQRLAQQLGERINTAIAEEDWCGVAEALERHHRDRGKPLTEENLNAIGEAFIVSADTTPILSGKRDKQATSLDVGMSGQ